MRKDCHGPCRTCDRCECADIYPMIDRLAAYEDTGLEPEGVKEHETAYIEIMTRTYGPFRQKISQWMQAEKDGRLVVLPVKEGSKIYRVRLNFGRFWEDYIPDPRRSRGGAEKEGGSRQ